MPRKGVYMSLDDLKTAVRALGINRRPDYKSHYKEIPSAPSDPNYVYDTWVGWPDLFGRPRVPRSTSCNFKHGGATGGKASLTYASWQAMMHRCFSSRNKRYEKYGGAGVTVCERWRDPEKGFLNFLADMGARPEGTTLGRFGDSGNYEPENCAWQTRAEQQAEQLKKRGNRCNRGHEFTPDNTGINSHGHRFCLTCNDEWWRIRRSEPLLQKAA